MKDLEQWVCWRSEARGRDGKRTKVPYSPASGVRARSDDPDTWGTLAEAEEAANKGDYDGIGFVFTARDPFCGVDLDSCVDPETGEIEPWARNSLDELDSYAEFSPSGTGLARHSQGQAAARRQPQGPRGDVRPGSLLHRNQAPAARHLPSRRRAPGGDRGAPRPPLPPGRTARPNKDAGHERRCRLRRPHGRTRSCAER